MKTFALAVEFLSIVEISKFPDEPFSNSTEKGGGVPKHEYM
jgi:hypothetical protein